MGVTASVNRDHFEVAPGSEAACEVVVHNSGDLVDRFTVEVMGAAADWSAVEPPAVNLLPGTEATVRIAFSPPRSSEVRAGTVPFGIRIRSSEDAHGSVVEEGEVTVTPFLEVTAEIVPPKGRGSRKAKYRLVIDNTGNREVTAELTSVDPEDVLQIELTPQVVELPPGTATVVKAKVSPNKRFLRGDPKTHQFQLVVLPEGEDPVSANASMLQLALLPRWLLPALAVLVAAVIALVVLWYSLLKPSVKSLAQEATSQQASQAASAAKSAKAAASKAAGAASAAQGGSDKKSPAGSTSKKKNGSDSSSSSAKAGDSDSTNKGASGPVAFRIAASAKPVTNDSFQRFSYVAPKHATMSVSDIVLQNPHGDTGLLELLIGDHVILQEGMANFRDLDYHYVVPLHVAKDVPVVVAVNCTTPGAGQKKCTPSVSFSGQLGK